MHAVLDILFGGQAWEDMISGLRMAVNVRVMTQHANVAFDNEREDLEQRVADCTIESQRMVG